MTQLRLDGMMTPRVFRPARDRTEPAVWVRSLRIVRELSGEPSDVIREVQLRRGLNIVWAPPQASTVTTSSDHGSMAGHTAGKTSFVRMLRYVVGDRHFANDAVRRRVRERIPLAHVLAEVVVAGETWGVARPLGLGAHPFCVRGATLDEIASADPRGDFRDYLDAISAAALSALPATRFPDTDATIGWEHLLPWLTRDQECRFANFADWRHADSVSDSPALTGDQRQFLMRAVLDLVTDAERAELERNERLVAEKKRLVARQPLVEHQALTDNSRLSRLFGDEVTTGHGLFVEARHAAIEVLRQQLNAFRTRLADAAAMRDEATRERDHARDVEVRARRDVEDAQSRLEVERAALDQLDARIAGRSSTALLAALPSGRAYCNVPLAEARASGCPLVSTRVVSLDETRGTHQPADERTQQAGVVDALTRQVNVTHVALASAETAQRAAHAGYLRAQSAYDNERDAVRNEEARLRDAERLVAHAESSWREVSTISDEVQRLTAEIEISYERQKALRQQRQQALGALSATFEHVVQSLLGPSVQARVEASGRSLALHVERDGERESAALATVKLLAFDLAALTTSIEGGGAFPRLLVHDGPREADLAADIYARLFFYARDLERASSGEPSFQYVLTTTTDPPAELQGEPWVRLLLSGAAGDARLYRMDL